MHDPYRTDNAVRGTNRLSQTTWRIDDQKRFLFFIRRIFKSVFKHEERKQKCQRQGCHGASAASVADSMPTARMLAFALVDFEDADKWSDHLEIWRTSLGLREASWRRYNATIGEFPSEEELDQLQGVVIPGSRHSATDQRWQGVPLHLLCMHTHHLVSLCTADSGGCEFVRHVVSRQRPQVRVAVAVAPRSVGRGEVCRSCSYTADVLEASCWR